MITTNLYSHQIRVLEETENNNRVGYFLDMGLGKTFVGAAKMMLLGETFNLVVCQKSKIWDWIEHFEQYYSKHPWCTNVYDLTNKKRFEQFLEVSNEWQYYTEVTDDLTGETYLQHSTDPCQYIGVINYELAWRRKDLLNLKRFTLMLDESSLIQNPKIFP